MGYFAEERVSFHFVAGSVCNSENQCLQPSSSWVASEDKWFKKKFDIDINKYEV